ncbi:hypothetical protein GCM10017710_21760 [Arthrobacter ramosus]
MKRESVPAEQAKSVGSLEPSETFLAEYYAQVPPEDLRSYSPETLRAPAAHHLKVASSRAPRQAAVGILAELDASVVAEVREPARAAGFAGPSVARDSARAPMCILRPSRAAPAEGSSPTQTWESHRRTPPIARA